MNYNHGMATSFQYNDISGQGRSDHIYPRHPSPVTRHHLSPLMKQSTVSLYMSVKFSFFSTVCCSFLK